MPSAGSVHHARAVGFPRPPASAASARVTHVSDGDTVSLSGIGKVRLVGIDTPEVYGGAECYGAAASRFTERVLRPGTSVRYRLGREPRDRYGRALAYVWLADGTLFNGVLAERGYATPLTIPPNDDYASEFVAAARRARRAARGLWSSAVCAGRNAPALAAPEHRASGGCARFRRHADAQQWWEQHGRPDGMDGDGDGQVCEGLP